MTPGARTEKEESNSVQLQISVQKKNKKAINRSKEEEEIFPLRQKNELGYIGSKSAPLISGCDFMWSFGLEVALLIEKRAA